MQKPRIIASTGLPQACRRSFAWSAMALYSFTASIVPRRSPNCEMSAPDTKALSPAPVMMITRISGSAS